MRPPTSGFLTSTGAVQTGLRIAAGLRDSEAISQRELDLPGRLGRKDAAESAWDIGEVLRHVEVHAVQGVEGLCFENDGAVLAQLKSARDRCIHGEQPGAEGCCGRHCRKCT